MNKFLLVLLHHKRFRLRAPRPRHRWVNGRSRVPTVASILRTYHNFLRIVKFSNSDFNFWCPREVCRVLYKNFTRLYEKLVEIDKKNYKFFPNGSKNPTVASIFKT